MRGFLEAVRGVSAVPSLQRSVSRSDQLGKLRATLEGCTHAAGIDCPRLERCRTARNGFPGALPGSSPLCCRVISGRSVSPFGGIGRLLFTWATLPRPGVWRVSNSVVPFRLRVLPCPWGECGRRVAVSVSCPWGLNRWPLLPSWGALGNRCCWAWCRGLSHPIR